MQRFLPDATEELEKDEGPVARDDRGEGVDGELDEQRAQQGDSAALQIGQVSPDARSNYHTCNFYILLSQPYFLYSHR